MDHVMTAAIRCISAALVVSGLIVAVSGCASPAGHQGRDGARPMMTDSTTIILSKFYSSHNYRHWLDRLSQVAEVPPLRFVQAYGLDEEALIDALAGADAVVLTGGEDIHPARYGQPADTERCGRIDIERDRVELALLDHVIQHGLPCLGVCRGLQVMNVHGGGTLHPHLPDAGWDGHSGGAPGATSDTLHPIAVSSPWSSGGERFEDDSPSAIGYVSHHHQGIDRLAASYQPWATAGDGLIEGIRYGDTAHAPFIVGVQWHPERSEPGHVLSDGLGIALLRAAAN